MSRDNGSLSFSSGLLGGMLGRSGVNGVAGSSFAGVVGESMASGDAFKAVSSWTNHISTISISGLLGDHLNEHYHTVIQISQGCQISIRCHQVALVDCFYCQEVRF